MAFQGFRPPKLLVFALFLSPVLVFLHACGERDQSSSHRSKTHASRSKSGADLFSRGPQKTLASNRSAFENLTATNAEQVRDQLRADSKRWANQIAPFYRAWGTLAPSEALASATAEGKLSLPATLGTVEGWTTLDPGQALNWVTQQKPEALRSRYAGALIKAWPPDDLAALAAWSQDVPSVLPQVTLKWSHLDPLETARWLRSLPAASHHRQATEALFRQWASADPGAAGDYLVATRTFPNRDAAVAAYATTVVRDDPSAAHDWAHEISDAALRQRVLRALPSLRPLAESSPDRNDRR